MAAVTERGRHGGDGGRQGRLEAELLRWLGLEATLGDDGSGYDWSGYGIWA